MKKTLLALSALLISGSAFAQAYVGITGGLSELKIDCAGATSCDTRDNGFKLYGGYKFNHVGAVEIGYTDYGSAHGSIGSFSASYSTTSFSLGGAAFLPLTPKLTAIGRLGLAYSDVSVSGSLGPFRTSESGTDTHPYLGLGLAFALTPKLSLTGSYDFARIKYDGDRTTTTLLGLGLSYGF